MWRHCRCHLVRRRRPHCRLSPRHTPTTLASSFIATATGPQSPCPATSHGQICSRAVCRSSDMQQHQICSSVKRRTLRASRSVTLVTPINSLYSRRRSSACTRCMATQRLPMLTTPLGGPLTFQFPGGVEYNGRILNELRAADVGRLNRVPCHLGERPLQSWPTIKKTGQNGLP